MRDLLDIQSDNRRAAINRNNAAVYEALIDLIGKAKAAGWKEETTRKAEDLVRIIEKAATGRDNVFVAARP